MLDRSVLQMLQSIATNSDRCSSRDESTIEFNGILIFHQETAKEPHPNLNFIHTERPHWATKPAQLKPSSTDFPKPFFSVKTTTYRPISISGQADQRPNFISKPNVWIISTKPSTTTTVGPIFKQPSTRYAICLRVVRSSIIL